jgi:hypothetical protein
MTDEKKAADPKPSAEDRATSAHKITRRRFTKAGALAPVIMTLGGRPVWGQAVCTGSAAASFAHASHAPCEQATTILTRTADEWAKDALSGTWPSASQYPTFTVTPSSRFSSLLGPAEEHACSASDLRKLMDRQLMVVLTDRSGVKNNELRRLAKHATAAQLNALFAQGVAKTLDINRPLFPMTPEDIYREFWRAILQDCGSSVGVDSGITVLSTSSVSTYSMTGQGQNSKLKSNCNTYNQGIAMSVLSSDFETLNQSGAAL